MDQPANDMVLGTSAYKAGIRATTFGPRDRGIGYLVGASDDPQIVRSAYLDGPATERIVVRARAARLAAGTLSGHALGEVQPAADEAALDPRPHPDRRPGRRGQGLVGDRGRPAGRAAPGPLRRLGTRAARRRAQAARHRHGPDQARRHDGTGRSTAAGIDREDIAAAVAERDRAAPAAALHPSPRRTASA